MQQNIEASLRSGAISKEEAEILLEEMLADAMEAQEPGINNRIIQSGELPMIVSELASAGYVIVYKVDGQHPDAREPSIINRNSLLQQLTKMLPDGRRAFTTKKPDVPPFRGSVKCLLHADNPDRPQYAALGLPLCDKDNLRNEYQLTQHMRSKHPREYDAILGATREDDSDAQTIKALKAIIVRLNSLEGKADDEVD